MRFSLLPLVGLYSLVRVTSLVAQPAGPPSVVPHSAWQAKPPLGIPADAARRNKKAGDSLSFTGSP
jgi:hypothetical protein